MSMREKVEELERRRAEAQKMGGEARLARQKERGKLDARARIALLVDPGTFHEIGLLATHLGKLDADPPAPADGVVCGTGFIGGRPACVASYDFTVRGGSIGPVGERKVSRLRELALRERIPMVWLIDSAGARLSADPEEASWVASFADTGYLFREQVVMSGVVPQVAAMVGPGAAGTAYIPGLADFVPMVKGTSSIAIGGPYLVKSIVGEEIGEEELGGSKVHCEISGVADLEVPDDASCMAVVREYLGYFPLRAGEKPPRLPCADPAGRRDDSLLDVIPESPRQAYDVKKIISRIIDESRFLEIKPRWAKSIVCALARIDGRPVGIVANNPMQSGGVLDVNAADKAARFVNLCDAFEIPLVFLQDVPGFMVGSKVEQQGIIRHGAKMLYAVASATVPKLTVVLRKGYGAGYYVMNGRAYEPDVLLAWPGAEISVMGAEGMVAIAANKQLLQSSEPEALKKQLADAIRPQIDIYRTAALGFVDDVIDPRETRPLLAHYLSMTENKRVERPWRKREVAPV
ncbi:MAG: acyl-CoA carboxylase subunit beta [Deltaproteobacteria bacterium]|nr:MAG: acyl-CoA carboxylase subunit beta [Deltaproteobacteria bacterium]